MNNKIPKRINLNKKIQLGNKKLTVLEYLRDTEYPAVLIKIMTEQNCTALEALEYIKQNNIEI